MEERRFDELTRVLGAATTRRQVLKGVLGAAVGVALTSVGLRAPRAAEAATPLCNGDPYDPASQCCEPAGVQPRHPIVDLAFCPDRVPHPGHVPSFNGCGPEKGFIRRIIPNRIGPYRNIDFTSSCNNHDLCYDTCNSEKSTCDQNFLTDLRAACAAAYPGNGYVDRYMRAGCNANAYIYYTAVSQTPTGTDAYESAQKEACDCCPVCTECGGSGDERCCQGTCYDPCAEGQQRNPDTCVCDPCFGQSDGTVCGTNEVCCQQGCVNNQCPTGKTFSYGTCGCICEPIQCPTGEHQDLNTCGCVQVCTSTSCGECETCDSNTGQCVTVDDLTACGTNQVCCGGFCLDSCSGPLCPSGQFACAVTPPYNPGNNNSRPAFVCCDNGAACCGGTGYLYDICTGTTYQDTYVCCKNGTNQCGVDCCDHVTEACLQASDYSLHCCPADAGAVLPDGTCCAPGAYAMQCSNNAWICCSGSASNCCA